MARLYKGGEILVNLKMKVENKGKALEILEKMEPLIQELREVAESGFTISVEEEGEANVFREFVISAYDEVEEFLFTRVYAPWTIFEASHIASCRNYVTIKDEEAEKLERLQEEETEDAKHS